MIKKVLENLVNRFNKDISNISYDLDQGKITKDDANILTELVINELQNDIGLLKSLDISE